MIRMDGRCASTVRWGVAGGRVSMPPARRPVASWPLAISTAPIVAGFTSRHTGTRTKSSDVADELRAIRRSQLWSLRHHAHKLIANAPRAKRPFRHRHNATGKPKSLREHHAARHDEGEGILCCSTKCGINNVGSITGVLRPIVAKQ